MKRFQDWVIKQRELQVSYKTWSLPDTWSTGWISLDLDMQIQKSQKTLRECVKWGK